MLVRAVTVLALVATTLAAPSPMVVKESIQTPQDWVRRSAAPDSHTLNVRVALKRAGIEQLEARLLETSDPDHHLYGRHLTRDEVHAHLAPSARSTESVRRWLKDAGIEESVQKRSAAGDWLEFPLPVARAREMLGADYGVWEHRETGEMVVRTTSYSLPRELHEHVDLVQPSTHFGKPLALRTPVTEVQYLPDGYKPPTPDAQRADSTSAVPASCDVKSVDMQCLREFYNSASYVAKGRKDNQIFISGFLEQYANNDDFAAFRADQRPDQDKLGYNFTFKSVKGGLNTQSMPGVEANLDVQTVLGIAAPVKSTFVSVAGRPPYKADNYTPTNTNEPYEALYSYLVGLDDDKLPTVVSNSYGDNEQTVPLAYAKRVCDDIMALGARGVSVLFASGDFGVGPDNNCISNDDTNTYKFLPAFPASCPYVTTVGGTEAFSPETAVSKKYGGFFGGGGFSNYFKAPKYQRDIVSAYIKSLGSSNKGLYNTTGRGYPDLAGQASNFLIRYSGKYGRVGGTSASTPLIASIIGLLNDARLRQGKTSLGFLNPLIYSKLIGTKAFTDITIGTNDGCNTTGFPAQKGWDAATGIGTPNFKNLLKITLAN